MGLADYNKKLSLKDFFILFFLLLIIESTLLLAFILEKEIRLQIWKYALIFDFIYFLLLVINKYIKSNFIYLFSTFFIPAFRTLPNMAIILIIYSIGFNIEWFSIVFLFYSVIWLFLFFPADQLKKINTFFVENKIVKIVFFIILLIAILGNNRYAIRYKSIESLKWGGARLGFGALIFNYYLIILGVTSAKESVKMFEKRKLEEKKEQNG